MSYNYTTVLSMLNDEIMTLEQLINNPKVQITFDSDAKNNPEILKHKRLELSNYPEAFFAVNNQRKIIEYPDIYRHQANTF